MATAEPSGEPSAAEYVLNEACAHARTLKGNGHSPLAARMSDDLDVAGGRHERCTFTSFDGSKRAARAARIGR